MRKKFLAALLSVPLALESLVVPAAAKDFSAHPSEVLLETEEPLYEEFAAESDENDFKEADSDGETVQTDLSAINDNQKNDESVESEEEKHPTNASSKSVKAPKSATQFVSVSEIKTYDDFEYQIVDDSEITITGYTGGSSDLTIPSVINGLPITSIGQRAFLNCSSLQSVSLPDSLKKIEREAFWGTRLVEIDIPDSVTYLGRWAFCSSTLKKVGYPASLQTADCGSNYATTWSGGPFAGCPGLKEVVIDEGVTRLPANIFRYDSSSAPENAVGLETVQLPSTLEKIGSSAFKGCWHLTAIELPNSITSLETECFMGCNSLSSVIFSPSLESVGQRAFLNCSSLQSVSLPDSLKKIEREAFWGTRLVEIDIPDSVTYLGRWAFCSSTLKKVGYPASLQTADCGSNYASTLSGGPFAGCPGLKEVVIDEGVTRLPDNIFRYDSDNYPNNAIGLETIQLPSTLEKIGNYAFKGCRHLTTMILPKSLLHIGRSNLSDTLEIYYEGSESDWNLVDIEDTDVLDNIVVYYNYFYGFKGHPDNPKTYYGPMLKEDFQNICIGFLKNDANYPATLLVSEKDPKFGTKLCGFVSNTLFRGIDGWEEQFLQMGSTKSAQEMLIGFISESSSVVEKIADANTTIKYGKDAIEALKTFTSGKMLESMGDSGMLNVIANKINTSQSQSSFMNLILDGDCDKIADYFCKNTDVSVGQMTDFMEEFYSSSSYLDMVGKAMKNLGYVGKIAKATSQTFANLKDLDTLRCANELYIDCLSYLAQNCNFTPVRTAAANLKSSLNDRFSATMQVMYDALATSGNLIIDGVINDACQMLPPTVLLWKAAAYLGIALGNGLFAIDEAQEAYDKLRVAAYMNTTMSQWVEKKNNEFKSAYNNGSEDHIQEHADALIGSLSLLATSRENGETVLQNYLDSYRFFGFPNPLKNNELFQLSESVVSTLQSHVRYYDLKNKGIKYLSLCVACPVDLSILALDGTTTLSLANGQIASGEQNEIYFSASINPLTGDSLKTVSIPEGAGLSLKLNAQALGAVDYTILSIDDNGLLQRRSLSNIPVNKGDSISANQITFTSDLSKVNASDNRQTTLTPVIRDGNNEIPVTSIQVNPTNVTLQTDQKVCITPTVIPSNATVSDVYWTSENENIATVSDEGVITSVAPGKTTILAHTLNCVTTKISVEVTNQSKPNPIQISSATVSNISTEYSFTGIAITPEPKVTLNDVTLIKDTDYTVTYSNNETPGTATITITGKGNYTGTKKVTFSIVKTQDAAKRVTMHRLYNPNSGEHFYTAVDNEKNFLANNGWMYEGTGWIAPESSKTPVYRLYNKNAGDHHYTMNANEKDFLVKSGWTYEGIGWYSDDAQGVPLYRQYNPNAQAGSHNYTPNIKENDFLVQNGWKAEGISWYGLK